MAAKKKSASRRSAAKKARSRKSPKRPAAKKAAPRKRAPAAKKKAAPRRKLAAKPAQPPKAPSPALAEIDRRIALVQNNLRDLTEQAAATSGSGSEDALSDRITGQEAELQHLRQERDTLVKSGGG
jgi:hypothetical protein